MFNVASNKKRFIGKHAPPGQSACVDVTYEGAWFSGIIRRLMAWRGWKPGELAGLSLLAPNIHDPLIDFGVLTSSFSVVQDLSFGERIGHADTIPYG